LKDERHSIIYQGEL